MKPQTIEVEIAYKYKITYRDEKGLKEAIKDFKNQANIIWSGAYSAKRIGKGRLIDKKV